MLGNDKNVLTFNIIANNSLITPKVGMSGGDRIFLELVRYLSRHKVPVNLFTGVNVQQSINQNNIGKVSFYLYSEQSFSVYGNLFLNSLLKIFLGIKSALKYKHKDNSKLVIYSASDFWPDVVPALIMKLRNRGSIWIGSFYQFAPAPWQKDSPYKGRSWMKGVLYWMMQRPVYWLIRNFAEIVFVTSQPDVSFFPDHRRKGDYFVVQGGVDLEPSREYLNSRKDIRGDKKKYDACFLGRLHPQKGVVELIDIWRLVVNKKPDAKLALIGNGPLREKLVDRIKNLSLETNIDLMGFKDGEDKYEIFKQSKLVLHPATYDSGGMAAAEAMAWGLPGISFNLESLKTYYPKGMLKVDRSDLVTFASQIIKLLEDDKLRKKIGADASELIALNWSWDKRINDIYQFLLLKNTF